MQKIAILFLQQPLSQFPIFFPTVIGSCSELCQVGTKLEGAVIGARCLGFHTKLCGLGVFELACALYLFASTNWITTSVGKVLGSPFLFVTFCQGNFHLVTL